MSKTSPVIPLRYLFHTFLFVIAFSSLASADDRFAVAVGSHDILVIFGPNGQRVAELPVPSISQSVTIGATTFQVSYGRDANNLLTAILAPNPNQPQDLHFNVLNKSVDTDKEAVVTLTFSSNANRVSVDPGYVGTVAVNSHSVRHHDLADDSYPAPPSSQPHMAPAATASADEVTDIPRHTTPPALRPVATTSSSSDMPPLHASSASSASVASTSSSSAASSTPVHESPPPASEPSQPPVVDGGTISRAEVASTSVVEPINTGAGAKSAAAASEPVYWSEPITPPNGVPPRVGTNEMKLVEVQGNVSVLTASGSPEAAREGMILPSGATVQTADNSSAAVFMGGVNSARFLPDSEASVSQNLKGTIRKTTIDLHQGTVFSRVGRRPGETQSYEVRTPEGVAAARGTEFADHHGRGHHYVFVAKGTVELFMGGNTYKLVNGGDGDVGNGVMPPSNDADQVFREIMALLQPFNLKLQGVLERIGNGSATPGDLAFYNALKNTYYGDFGGASGDTNIPGIPSDTGYGGSPHSHVQTPQDYLYPDPNTFIPRHRRARDQDFEPFGTQPLTPF